MSKILRHIATAIFFISFTAPLLAQSSSTSSLVIDRNIAQPSPFDDWKTLSTEHFNINYQDRHFAFAQRMAVIAEKVSEKFTVALKWQPEKKTEIVINDSVDFSNGGAIPFPYNQFFIYMSPPIDGDLLDHTGWVEQVFTHEYTHILHGDQVSGTPKVLRKIFGSASGLLTFLSYPELFSPKWVAEGLAVNSESNKGFGRGNSAIYESQMRQEVLTGLRSFTDESFEGYSSSRWPFGQVYLYGTYFYQFVEHEYGEEKIVDYITNYNGNLIPWRMNKRATQTFNIGSEELWAKFELYLRKRFSPQIEAIKKYGEMPGKVLVADEYINEYITAGPEGSLYYYHNDAINSPVIKQVNRNGVKKNIIDVRGVSYLDWNSKNGLMVGKAEVCNNVDIFLDIYVIAPGSKKLNRLTECARLVKAKWAKSGEKIVAVRVTDGKSSIVSITLDGKIQPLLTMSEGEYVGDFDLSPDGGKMLANIRRNASGWNLEELDFKTLTWSSLTRSTRLERLPRYAPNSNDVIFISGSDYQLEVKRLNVSSDTVSTLTNSLGYIKEFIPVAGNGLWVVEYTGSKQQIRFISSVRAIGATVKNDNQAVDTRQFIDSQPNDVPSENGTGKDYSVWHTLKPMGWSPIIAIGDAQDSRVGVLVEGQDVLGFHQWFAEPVYYFEDEIDKIGGVFLYDFYNRFSIFAENSVSVTSRDPNTNKGIEWDEEERYQALIHYPINQLDWAIDFALGVATEKITTNLINTDYTTDIDNTLFGGTISFNNLKFYPHGISVTDGVSARLTLETYDALASSDNSGDASIGEFDAYVNLGRKHTLKFSALYATGDEHIKPFRLAGVNDKPSFTGDLTQLGRRKFSLRGYETSPELYGSNIARAIIEWRIPIGMFYYGWNAFPIGVGKIWSNVFADTGSVWGLGQSKPTYTGVGVEIGFELQIGFDSILVPVVLGVAEGLDEELGTTQYYLNTVFGF
ncbi:MAG: hypothetical protein ACC707_00485 [Thiohalomonadales bacterium]